MIKAKVWGKQVKTPSAKMASKAHTKMMSTPENKAFRQRGVDAMKGAVKGAVKMPSPVKKVSKIGSVTVPKFKTREEIASHIKQARQKPVVVPKRGMLQGEERKLFKLTGKVGMKRSKK